jgi:hypothetical protein
MATTIFAEIQARLDLMEAEVERMRRRFRSLPPDHPDRGALLRQLEIAAAVAGELESALRPAAAELERRWNQALTTEAQLEAELRRLR